MPDADRRDAHARDRREADRRYNDALTALDRAVVDLGARDDLTRHDVQQLGSLLLVFLQQVTPYVDTKLREAAASTQIVLDAHAGALETVRGLQDEIALLQRAMQALKRERPAPAAAATVPPSTGSAHDDFTYLGFEDRFRGSEDEIRGRLRAYLPLFAGASSVVDLGCGRGEFLALLGEQGVAARGVDVNREMVAVARDRGLDAAEGDALTYLRSLPDASSGGLIAAQVVEHLDPGYLVRLLETAYDKLEPGAPIVVETINPACWLAFFSSYLRDFTHVRPIHPDTLRYLLEACGFTRVSVRFSAPVPEHMKMAPVELSPGIAGSTEPAARALADAAHVVNANAAILNNLLFSHMDYAAIGYRS